jgi:hypothetical protein
VLAELTQSLAQYGLILRGGFHPSASEDGGIQDAATVLVVGNAGPAMWEAFRSHMDEQRNPLDRWSKSVIDPIAQKFGARAIYPFGPGAPPFQRWALRAETVYPSPLGILIHPEFGLWHAYRAALLFAEHLDLPPRSSAPRPCDSCVEKPCLSACPVGAFTGAAYDVAACASHLASSEQACLTAGCLARNACPVGYEWRYPEAQIRFHMAAFNRALGRDAGRGVRPEPALLAERPTTAL